MGFNDWRATFDKGDWEEEDRKLFERFVKDASKHQIGDHRIEKYRSAFVSARKLAGKPVFQIMKNIGTFGDFIAAVNKHPTYAPATKRGLKLILGSVYNFKHTGDRSMKYASREVKMLTEHKTKAADKRIAKPIITREEIRALSSSTRDTMDKAIVWLIFESGMRIGEFEQLTRGDIQQDKDGLVVRVPAGKTGERMIFISEARKFVNAWLDAHPLKDKNAPLWYSQETKGGIGARGIYKRILKLVERMNEARAKQGIPKFEKSPNPHNFRHSRASELGGEQGMTEQILCKYFGWEIGSDMPRTYLHLTEAQVKRAVLRTYGKAKPEEEKKIITEWTCGTCQEENPIEKNYCGKCGSSRDGKVISKTAQLEAQLKDAMERIEKLEEDKAEETVSETKKIKER